MIGQQKIALAKSMAEAAHFGQKYGNATYMYHVEAVVSIADAIVTQNHDDIIAACYLHDAMEDGALSYSDISKPLGRNVAEIVFAVTDELGKNRKERKAKTMTKIAARADFVLVKLFDRIANVSHSKATNDHNKFGMYQKEHEDFCKALKVDDWAKRNSDIDYAWSELIDLFS